MACWDTRHHRDHGWRRRARRDYEERDAEEAGQRDPMTRGTSRMKSPQRPCLPRRLRHRRLLPRHLRRLHAREHPGWINPEFSGVAQPVNEVGAPGGDTSMVPVKARPKHPPIHLNLGGSASSGTTSAPRYTVNRQLARALFLCTSKCATTSFTAVRPLELSGDVARFDDCRQGSDIPR